MRRPRRNHTGTFKAKAALAALKGGAAGGAGAEVRCARQPDHAMEESIAGGSDRGIYVAGEEARYRSGPEREGHASQDRATCIGS